MAAGGPGDAIAQLPREWDEALPTSGFWVLNVAPPPSAEAAAGPEEGPPMPADLVTTPPSAARPWWRRLLAGLAPARDASASGHPGADGRQAEPAVAAAGADAPGGDAAASGEAPSSEAASAEAGPDASAGPVGVLVSADRYDLSES